MNLRVPADDREPMVAFGKQVIGRAAKSARLGLGLSQRQLGRRAGISQSVISRLETGRLAGLRWQTFARIVAVLNVGPGFRFLRDESPPTRRLPGQPPTR